MLNLLQIFKLSPLILLRNRWKQITKCDCMFAKQNWTQQWWINKSLLSGLGLFNENELLTIKNLLTWRILIVRLVLFYLTKNYRHCCLGTAYHAQLLLRNSSKFSWNLDSVSQGIFKIIHSAWVFQVLTEYYFKNESWFFILYSVGIDNKEFKFDECFFKLRLRYPVVVWKDVKKRQFSILKLNFTVLTESKLRKLIGSWYVVFNFYCQLQCP